jgi:hypothetical protein
MDKRRNGHRNGNGHGRGRGLDPNLATPWSNIGRTWMKVGLNMGKVALETSIETLRTAADTLDKLSRAADAGRAPTCGEPAEVNRQNGAEGREQADAAAEPIPPAGEKTA